MRKGRAALLALPASIALAVALAVGPSGGASPAPAVAGAGPIALLATPARADATESEVRLVEVTGSGATSTVFRARIVHARGAVVRGDVLDGGRAVVLAADEAGATEPDWGAALHRVDAAGARVLARGLYHASRPLVSADGSVYVERGASGPWPTREEARAGRLRTDALTIDAIDPVTGAARTVATSRGYTLHLAGELGGDLVVYRVAYEGAELLAIDRASGQVRTVTALSPFARDFSIDAARGAVVMSNRDEQDSRTWVVDRVDLRTGARERLHTQKDEAPVPYLTATGDVRWARDDAPATPHGAFALRLAAAGERVTPIGGGLR
jgi:hypothetical protein